jgi:hypothetical protein
MVAAIVTVALFYVEWYYILTAAVFMGGRWAFAEEFFPEDNWLFNGPYSRWYIVAIPVPLLYLGLFFVPWLQLGVAAGVAGVTVAAQLRPHRRRGRVIRWATFGLSLILAAVCGLMLWSQPTATPRIP